MIHWELCKKLQFDLTNKAYKHNPESVLENETHKLLWNFEIQTDHQISARRPDLIIINKKKKKKKKKRELHSLGQILGCAYNICSYGQTSTSCTTPSGSPCPPCRVSSYTLSVLICCIRLSCDWSFRLFHHITYICCIVASYQFSLWHG